MRFLVLSLYQSVPDAKAIWLYRERLKKKGMMDGLFSLFDQALRERGYLAMGGRGCYDYPGTPSTYDHRREILGEVRGESSTLEREPCKTFQKC